MKTLIVSALLVLFCSLQVEAQQRQTPCGDREEILNQLSSKHNEEPHAIALSADGGILEVLVAPNGSWTIIMTYPGKSTCVVAVGQYWENLNVGDLV